MLILNWVGRAAIAAALLGVTCAHAQDAAGANREPAAQNAAQVAPSTEEGPAAGAAPNPPASQAAASQPPVTAAQPAATTAAAPAAPVPAATQEQQLLLWLQSQVDGAGQPCSAPKLAQAGDLYYVACGAAGLWIVRAFPTGFSLLERRAVGGNAVGLSATPDGQLFVRVAGQAQGAPESLVPASQPPAPPQQAPVARTAAPAAINGQVVEVKPGEAVINMGTAQGIKVDDHVRLFPPSEPGSNDPPSRRRIIGVVSSVSDSRSRVALGVNEWVRVGDVAETTSADDTASLSAPPQALGPWDMGLMLRPFLTTSDLGAGVVMDGWVGIRPVGPLRLDLRLSPAGFASGKDGGVGSFRLYGLVSFDHRLFAGGLGFGAQSMKLGSRSSAVVPTFLQEIRIGSLDGLHIRGTTGIAINNDEFEFAGLRVMTQIPLGRGAWLLLGGGGGSEGIAFGELGVRALLLGNGEQDSMFLSVTLGGAGVFESYYTNDYDVEESNTSYGGPHLGLGLEYRL